MQEDERDRLARRLREVLIEARKVRGLNQTELAAALKRTQTFVSNYERGERRLGAVDFVLIARVLGEEPMELLRRLD
ncbi:MAG TPA: helix-turn-helix transcriptional regulator [Allosphingosinicella sp.]|nr:helix-turn-helix transcriptional regulator [Allosphingosinicella sp.]